MNRKRITPGIIVLGLLCLMYMITYIDRVNISTAANAIKKELGLPVHRQRTILSARYSDSHLI